MDNKRGKFLIVLVRSVYKTTSKISKWSFIDTEPIKLWTENKDTRIRSKLKSFPFKLFESNKEKERKKQK